MFSVFFNIFFSAHKGGESEFLIVSLVPFALYYFKQQEQQQQQQQQQQQLQKINKNSNNTNTYKNGTYEKNGRKMANY